MQQLTYKHLVKHRQFIVGLLIATVLFASSLCLYRLSPYNSSNDSYRYYRATVIQTGKQRGADVGQLRVMARLMDGPARGQTITVSWVNNYGDAAARRLPIGSQLLLGKNPRAGNYGVISRWYMPGMATILLTLATLVIAIGAWRGITSMLGLAISIGILAIFVIPHIMAGDNAFLVCSVAAVAITFVSIYVAHGISKRTTVALIASLLSLVLVMLLTAAASYVSGTSELLTEDSAYIFNTAHPINVSGLLTGGIVIASLGALFDITTGQAATVDEIHRTDSRQGTKQLFIKGMSVGREHIAALINTLALVYTGVALPGIVLTQAIYVQSSRYAEVPLLVRLNTESIAEEIMRTGVTSAAMLLAMPIATALAAFVLPRWTPAVSRRIKRWLAEA